MQGSQLAERQDGLLNVQLTRYSALNKEQSNLLSNLEERLHKVLNRQSNDKMVENPTPPINDFIGAMDAESERLAAQNRRLEKILIHLNELV